MLRAPTSRRDSAVASHSFGSETRLTAWLGGPLALGEVGWMSTYIVDAIMVGRMQHSALAISASSLGNSIFYAILFAAVGLLYGLDTLVSQAFGRGDRADCNRSLAQSFLLVIALTPPVMLASLFSPYVLTRVGVGTAIVTGTAAYLHALVWSTAPLLFYMAVRRYLQALDRPNLIMISLLSANVVDFVGDWALIYGHLGFRPMGIAGSGWATCIVRVYMLLLLVPALALSFRDTGSGLQWSFFAPDARRLRSLLKLGWPAGLQSLSELSVSTVCVVLAGKLGATLLAAHQVVLDLNAFVYMVPLGLSAAAAVRVGQGAGRRDMAQVRRAALAGLLLGGAFICAASLSFLLLPRVWARIYTTDMSVVAASVPIFFICAGSQIFDGTQVILSGALRGIGDTRTPMMTYLGWYWLVGVPMAALLCFHFHLALVGLWLGSACAAVPIALTLWLIWLRRLRQFAAVSPAVETEGVLQS